MATVIPRQCSSTLRVNVTNNEMSSTSSDDGMSNKAGVVYRKKRDTYSQDNEMCDILRNKSQLKSYSHHKSMGNIVDAVNNMDTFENNNLSRLQNSMSNLDLRMNDREFKKFEKFQIPIVGYEVMEERARFTIYKLKVEDDKRDQSWLVFRRYTDFVRLYNRIKTELPKLELPLPGKRWFKDNFDPTFLEARVNGLQIFVNAILAKLPNHPIVREFFCLDEPPQAVNYQPEIQAVYAALEDSILSLRMQLKQKDATVVHLMRRVAYLENQMKNCSNCSKQFS